MSKIKLEDDKVLEWIKFSEELKKETISQAHSHSAEEGKSYEIFFSVQKEINDILINMHDKFKDIKDDKVKLAFIAMDTIIVGVSIAFQRLDLMEALHDLFDEFMDEE